MPSRAAQLAIELIEHGADEVASGIDKVTSAAKDMDGTVDRASRTGEIAASRLDRAAESTDNLASKSSQATGGLGALASGFELVGLGPYAAGMQSAAMATDFFSGVGDIGNLVLESQAVASARARVATIAQTVATNASAVAQRALNLAMSANPVLLIVAGVTLLVAAFILAYKKSDTFREVVQKAMAVARAGVDKFLDGVQAISGVVSKVFGFIAKVIEGYVKAYVLAFTLVYKGAAEVFGQVQDKVSNVIGWVKDHAGDVSDKFTDVWHKVRDVAVDAMDAATAPVRALIDLVDGLLDKIKSIHVPHVDVNPFNRGGAGGVRDTSSAGGGDVINIDLTVNAAAGTSATDAATWAQAIMDAIDARLRMMGRKTVFAR